MILIEPFKDQSCTDCVLYPFKSFYEERFITILPLRSYVKRCPAAVSISTNALHTHTGFIPATFWSILLQWFSV